MPGSHKEYWDLNSGPPACDTNTKPSCSLSVILFRKVLCFMISLGIGSGIIFNPRTHQFIRRHQLIKRHRSAFLRVSHVCNSLSPKKELFSFFFLGLGEFPFCFSWKAIYNPGMVPLSGMCSRDHYWCWWWLYQSVWSRKAESPHPFQHAPDVPLSPNYDV